MNNELTTVYLLQASIAKKLGPKYIVNMNALTSSLSRSQEGEGHQSSLPELDLVIWGPNPNEPFIVEYKALRKGIDVPLSSVPLLIDLVDKNPGMQPHLIFATNGRVGSLVRSELQRRNIDVVESDDVSDMSIRISTIVQRKSESAETGNRSKPESDAGGVK